MANICNNEIHFNCAEEDLKVIESFMNSHFPNCECSYTDVCGDESHIEFYFDSKWVFPEEELNKLPKLLVKPDLYDGTCLSVEWGNLYCAFHSGNEDGWNYEN